MNEMKRLYKKFNEAQITTERKKQEKRAMGSKKISRNRY